MEFTSWDAGLRRINFNSLEHSGIKGMKWGVRRYQNSDGSLTEAGKARYGSAGNGASANKMTKDFNKLDQSYANVERRRQNYAHKAAKYARKAYRGTNSEKKLEKWKSKALKYGAKAGEANKQKVAIENLQMRIIGQAAKKGYTTTSKAVTRIGQMGKDKVASILLAGPKRGASVSGQEISIKKHGHGGTQIVNYNAAKSAGVQKVWQEEKDKERARQLAGARR